MIETILFWTGLYIALVSMGMGIFVAAQKGRPAPEGFWLGLVLGPFGVVVEACLPTLSIPARQPRAARPAPAAPPVERVSEATFVPVAAGDVERERLRRRMNGGA